MRSRRVELRPLATVDLAQPLGQCRAAPLNLGADRPPAILAAHSAVFDVDPYIEMFFFPTDTLKLTAFDVHGAVLWQRDLGPGVVPGMWFCPVLPYDLDGDGRDEVFFVNNVNERHPLALSGYRLERLDGRTGETTGQWPWPQVDGGQSLSHLFRNFLVAGTAHGRPVLVTAQGTYGELCLQGHGRELEPRWRTVIAADAPGARGSHMCPLVDLDRDGAFELLWGERCLRLDTGAEQFCADGDTWRGHSDIVQPVYDPASRGYSIYCCRESHAGQSPRVVLYNARGERIWGALDEGHIDMGWVARLTPERRLATAVRIGHKTCGPDGRHHEAIEEFAFDLADGAPVELGFSSYRTIPVDVDGDGLHELVRGLPGGDGELLDGAGRSLGNVGGPVALACKVNAVAGEQLLAYTPDGRLILWHDAGAADSHAAIARYTHPFYGANRRLMATGSNLPVLGGV